MLFGVSSLSGGPSWSIVALSTANLSIQHKVRSRRWRVFSVQVRTPVRSFFGAVWWCTSSLWLVLFGGFLILSRSRGRRMVERAHNFRGAGNHKT